MDTPKNVESTQYEKLTYANSSGLWLSKSSPQFVKICNAVSAKQIQ